MKLGSLYLNGEEIQNGENIYHHQDFEQATRWYRMAAKGGNKVARYYLGTRCGIPVPGEALKWLRLSAVQGYAPAQDELGGLYLNGEGVEKDFTQCVYWLRKAAEQGYPQAETCLGGRYEYGEGVPKDLATAFAWFKKSAEGGEAQGAGTVWKMYLYGQGTSKDEAAALAWYRLWSGDKPVMLKFPLQRQLSDEEKQRSDALYNELKERIKLHDDATDWPEWPG